MNETQEEWRPVTCRDGYEVSNLGRVKSLSRIVSHENRWGHMCDYRWAGRELKIIAHHTGYGVVRLGGFGRFGVHQLVAAAFNGPCPEGLVVNHKDGNKHNNVPENLEYVTNMDNVKHAYRTGLLNNTGANNGNAKLSDENVAEIRRMKGLKSAKELGAEYCVASAYVHRLWNNQMRKCG